jgi:hypothetical protein
VLAKIKAEAILNRFRFLARAFHSSRTFEKLQRPKRDL